MNDFLKYTIQVDEDQKEIILAFLSLLNTDMIEEMDTGYALSFEIDDQIEQFGPWNPKHNRWLARDEWDVILEQLMIIDHANRYLQSKKYIKQIINVSWSHDLPKELPNWCCWKWDLWNINTPGLKSLPKALDGMHVGEEAHKVIAAKMIKVQQQHHQNLTTGSN